MQYADAVAKGHYSVENEPSLNGMRDALYWLTTGLKPTLK